MSVLIRTDSPIISHRCTDSGPALRLCFPGGAHVKHGTRLTCEVCATTYEYHKPQPHPPGRDPYGRESGGRTHF